MTRCQTCNKGFPKAYAIERRSLGKLECIDCCMAREEEARRATPAAAGGNAGDRVATPGVKSTPDRATGDHPHWQTIVGFAGLH